MRRFYTLLYYLMLPGVLARLWWRGRKEPAYRERWAERFGFIDTVPAGCLWVHAVSLGETRAAVPLIRALQERYPDRPVLVTTMTPTGSRQVRDSFGSRVFHVYLPYDLPAAVQRFLQRTCPALGVVMETELWPNLLQLCRDADIPIVIANARLSARSARGYRCLLGLSRAMLRNTSLVAAQTEADGARFIQLGLDPGKLKVTGNIKYDLILPQGLVQYGQETRQTLFGARPVWIAASTHQGEDDVILTAFTQLQQQFPDLLLILTPRHPQRFDEVYVLCQQRKLQVIRRSSGEDCAPDVQVYLGDSVGELLMLYALADVAFVGGSLVPSGGHNVLEPAQLGVPVVFGPHMFNFTEASRHLLTAGGARQVKDSSELTEVLRLLLLDPNARQNMGMRAKQAVHANRGALARLFSLLEDILRQDEPPRTLPHNTPATRQPPV